jgi:hypothetical protein
VKKLKYFDGSRSFIENEEWLGGTKKAGEYGRIISNIV